ncbi:MAG: hypothetical protein MPJ22_08215 [Pirellulales bacterium]|nr:hypothetical protein [Pirellulales bacterium]
MRRLLGGGNTFRGDCGEGIWVNSEGEGSKPERRQHAGACRDLNVLNRSLVPNPLNYQLTRYNGDRSTLQDEHIPLIIKKIATTNA